MVFNSAASSPNEGGVLAAAIILPLAATVAIGLRLYVRSVKKTTFAWDDWTIFIALFLLWVLSILLYVGAALGSFGGHTAINPATGADVLTDKEFDIVKLLFAYYLVMSLAFGVIKLSVLFLYRRIFIGRTFNRYSLALIFIISLWTLAFFFATAFQCGTNITAWWTSTKTIKQYCVDTNSLELVFAVLDCFFDFMILIIPLPILYSLQLPTSQKIALSGVFLLGLLSTAAALARMAILIINVYDTTLGYRDLLGVDTNAIIWAHVEAGVAVIAATLPTLRPLFLGHSPESLLGSIKSKISLQSVGSKGSKTRKRRSITSDTQELSRITDTERTGSATYDRSQWKGEPEGWNSNVETQVSHNARDADHVPADSIMKQSNISQVVEDHGSHNV